MADTNGKLFYNGGLITCKWAVIKTQRFLFLNIRITAEGEMIGRAKKMKSNVIIINEPGMPS